MLEFADGLIGIAFGLANFDLSEQEPLVNSRIAAFEKLVYASCAFGVISSLVVFKGSSEVAYTIVGAVIGVALAWLAARKGAGWAAWLLILMAVVSTVGIVGALLGVTAITQALFTQKPDGLELAIEGIETVCLVAASYFYLTARTGAEA
ncbi:MAG: hypothetical protein KDJ90_00065 [Nitratireductor sp.]|nr:hypothetical protein [Nitratireductor sp.]